MATLHINLFDPKSIAECIARFESYSDKLDDACDKIEEELAKVVSEETSAAYSASPGDLIEGESTRGLGDWSISTSKSKDGTKVEATGDDAMFLEFGAGMATNGPAGGSPHPKGIEMGATIGSYGKGLASRLQIWPFKDSGGTHWSYGTTATCGMYDAAQTAKSLVDIVKESEMPTI